MRALNMLGIASLIVMLSAVALQFTEAYSFNDFIVAVYVSV
jgi:hypothetical protein